MTESSAPTRSPKSAETYQPDQSDHSNPPNAPVLPSGLDSGDVVLFNRRCTSMPVTGALLCVVSKLFSNSQWDHVGVVIRHPATGELLFLEADFGGVKLRSLEERVKRSKSNEIAVRRLSLVRTGSLREKFYAFAQEMVGRPYEIGTGSVMVRVSDPVAKQERERLNALLLDKEAQVEDISRELDIAVLTTFQKRLLKGERDRILDQCQKIRGRLQKEFDANSAIEKPGSFDMSSQKQLEKDLSRVFCSELVAAAYQRVGLLGSYPPPFYYSPKDFSSEQTHPPGLHLLKSARLSKELFVRKSARSTREVQDSTRRKSLRGVSDGDAPSRDSRSIIRDALKRTPIYAQVPDEYKRNHLLKSFRAKILEPGDVVFEQGQYGDQLYVIATGTVERFMQKGDEDPILLSTLGPRTTFGLTAFTFNTQRVSTIRAKERTLLWEVDKQTFELFKDSSSDIKSITTAAERRALRRLLQNHFLFNRLDKLGPNELDAFFHVKFRAGEDVFKQGDAGDNFYIIKSGELERHIRHPKGRHQTGENGIDRSDEEQLSRVKTLDPGQSFGELSLMYNAPRSATVRARTDAECWAISAESYHRLNLGGGTPRLHAIFKKNASVERDNEPYMTRADLLRFTEINAFPKECRERLAALLVSLVTSNRASDPIARKRKAMTNDDSRRSPDGAQTDADGKAEDYEDEGTLMDYWEFVRFDIVLNNPNAEMDFAFRLADKSNAGFITLDDMEDLLQDYAEIDKTASEMLNNGRSRLRSVFGKHGTKTLSAKEFQEASKDILPPTFRDDVKMITKHLLNMDVVGREQESEVEDLTFIEPDGAPSVIGSQFMHSFSRNGTRQSGLHQLSGYPPNAPKWIANIDWSHLVSVGISGSVSRTVVAPFERLKIIMQTKGPGQYSNGWISGTKSMIREDVSMTRALFRGNGANLIRIIPAAVIQLAMVDQLREMRGIRKLMEAPQATLVSNGQSQASEQLVSGSTRTRAVEAIIIGGIAGMVSAAATYPLDFIRGRLSVQRKGFEPYRGTFHGIGVAVQRDGFRSLYRGLGPTLAGGFPYVGLSFAIYETLRPILPKRNDGSGIATTGSSISCGILASATSQIASFPLDTCRRRMQVAKFDAHGSATATGFVGTWKEIGRQLGWKGYFRGLVPNLIKVAPASAVSFIAYEQVRGGMRTAEGVIDGFFAKSTPHVRSS